MAVAIRSLDGRDSEIAPTPLIPYAMIAIRKSLPQIGCVILRYVDRKGGFYRTVPSRTTAIHRRAQPRRRDRIRRRRQRHMRTPRERSQNRLLQPKPVGSHPNRLTLLQK